MTLLRNRIAHGRVVHPIRPARGTTISLYGCERMRALCEGCGRLIEHVTTWRDSRGCFLEVPRRTWQHEMDAHREAHVKSIVAAYAVRKETPR